MLASNEPRPELVDLPVLIVDDDGPSARLLSALLASEGCETRVAESAEDALAMLMVFKPALILLDLVLPLMSGLLLAQRLKANTYTRDIPIIAVSAINGPATQRMVLAAGCAAYVSKPIDAQAFPSLLVSVLGGEIS